jgi:hypothetical protein
MLQRWIKETFQRFARAPGTGLRCVRQGSYMNQEYVLLKVDKAEATASEKIIHKVTL